jgi:biotin operon repressor
MFGKKLNSITVISSYKEFLEASNLDVYERLLLRFILDLAPLKDKEHDFTVITNYSNDYLAKMLGCSRERIRQAKESLQARGILLVDEKTWEEYNLPSGKRFKPQNTQDVRVTPRFVAYLLGEISTWIFNYCKEFFVKLLKRKAAKFPKVKNGSLWEEDDWVNASKVVAPDPKIAEADKIAAKEMRQNILRKLFGRCDVIIKPWTDSTTRLVHNLINTGFAITEVARLLKQQDYVRDIDSGIILVNKILSS